MNLIIRIIIYSLLLIFHIFYSVVSAQNEPDKTNLQWNISDNGSSYAGIKMVNQIWARYIWNNPDINGTKQYSDIDLALWRSRFMMYANLMDKMFVYTQFGYDALTYRSENNPGIKLINAQTEYILYKNKLHLGFGLHSWNGISRYNNSAFWSYLVADNPGFVHPLNNTFSQSGSQLGIYAKGNVGILNYRISIVKPFEAGTDSISSIATTEKINENFALKGYFSLQLMDKENSLFPYMTMNNLGNDRILNIGAGFYYHPEAMLAEAEKDLSTVDPYLLQWLIANGAEDLIADFAEYGPSKVSDIFLASADLFVDLPLKNKGAVTSYLGYYYYFFGPNYLRSLHKMNVSKLTAEMSLPQGAGNSQWEVGTGHIVRGEWGYLFPEWILKFKLQPFGAFTYKDFEALDEASVQYDVGANFLIQYHNIKLTLQYSTRPVYTELENRRIIEEYKGQFILQTQLYF